MIIFLNKLPIPNLKHYCLFSFTLLVIVIIYANKLLHDIKNNTFNSNVNRIVNETIDSNAINNADASSYSNLNSNYSVYMEKYGYFYTAYKAVTNEPWCIWVLINFCYCVIILFSKVIQRLIFGKLRALENQHIKDQFWNFIFLKFIFIFGVLNLENISEVVMWCKWFSIIGFLSIHCQISKDRFEYLSFSASTPLKSHIKVLTLLVLIQLTCVYLLFASFMSNKTVVLSWSMSLFMFAEALGLTLRTLYVITRYALHLYDIHNLAQLNNKGTIQYYIDFIFEISVVTIDFMHYLHMLVYGNFYLSMASLVICMELKRLFFDVKKRMKRHSNYLRVIEKMEKKFPWATREELEDTDKCAVCWDVLDKARRLPCSHMFHHNCLRSWLEQDTSCPTCRKSLQDDKDNQANLNRPVVNGENPTQAQTQNENLDQTQQAQFVQRNLFQFNGSRYISWLPNFSLQITNSANVLPALLRRTRANLEPERLAEMTQQISVMFPQVSIDLIQQNLQQTHSIELSIESILEQSMRNNNGNVNTPRRRNILNELVDDSDTNLDDEEDEEDETSSEDDLNRVNQVLADQVQGVRHRPNSLITRLFDSINTSVGQNTNNLNEANASQLLNLNQGHDQIGHSNINNFSDDSEIIAKYSTSPLLSENANTIMQRKRELLLNSKKRYLEKLNLAEQKQKISNELSSAVNSQSNGDGLPK